MASILALLALPHMAQSSPLIEYHMHMAPSADGTKRVALTFDACTKRVDDRILNALVENNIKATIFVTRRWSKRNPKAIATLTAHTELFEIENHGAEHVAAVEEPMVIYSDASAGSVEAVREEVVNGTAALHKYFGTEPTWFRGATANYTKSSMELIESMGFKIAGFTFSGDAGASYTSQKAAKVVRAAKDGDVILAHINHPELPAGAGVVEGILRLKAEGFNFVKLNEGF